MNKKNKTRKENKLSNNTQTLKKIEPSMMIVENEIWIFRFQPPMRLKLNFVTTKF